MDRGVHFHKCNFQVRTPRDPNWKGQGRYGQNVRTLSYCAVALRSRIF